MKKAMVLQDIKNTSSSDPDPVIPSRKRGERCKKSAPENAPPNSDNSSISDNITDNLNLPLLQRIQLQMAMSNAKKDASEVKEADSLTKVEEEVAYDPEASITMDVSLEDAEQSPNRQPSVPEIDFLAAPTPNRLDQSDGLNRAFFDLSNNDQSVTTPQISLLDTSAGVSLTCTEHIRELDVTPKSGPSEVSVSRQQNEDQLKRVTSSTLMSPDLLQIAEGFREDGNRNPQPQVQSDDTPGLVKIGKTEEEHIQTEGLSSARTLVEELDLEVAGAVSGRSTKHRKAPRRRSQQVFDIPRDVGKDLGSTVLEEIEKVEEESTKTEIIVTPSSTIASDGTRESQQVEASRLTPPSRCPKEGPTSSPGEGTELDQHTTENDQVEDTVTPSVSKVNDRKKTSRGRVKKKTPEPPPNPSPTPDESCHEDKSQENKEPKEATPPLCIISDRKKRVRGRPTKKKRPATAPSTSTEEEQSSISSEGTSQGDESVATDQGQTEGLATPSLCIINDGRRGSRGRRKREASNASPGDDRSSVTSEGTSSSGVSPTAEYIVDDEGRTGKKQKVSDSSSPAEASDSMESGTQGPVPESKADSTPVCIINDQRRKPRKKKARVSPTPSDEPPLAATSDQQVRSPAELAEPAAQGTTNDPAPKVPGVEVGAVEDEEEAYVNIKRRRRTKPAARTAVVQSPVEPSSLLQDVPENQTAETNVEKQPSTSSEEEEQKQKERELGELDDLDFGAVFAQVRKPKQQKRRRRSADFDISSASETLSPVTQGLEGLNWLDNPGPSRRSKRLRRKSLDLYRASISRQREEEEERQRLSAERMRESVEEDPFDEHLGEQLLEQSVEPEPAQQGEQADVSCGELSVESTSASDSTETSPEVGVSPASAESSGERRRSRRSPKPASTIPSVPDTVSETAPPKAKRARKGKKVNEPSIEEIYLNKLWRTQMPKEKVWETIFEAPKSTKSGTEEYMSHKRFKRHVNFDDFYATNRLKRRRQKALQLGWKPLTEKRDEIAAAHLEERIIELDRQLTEECNIPSISQLSKKNTPCPAIIVEECTLDNEDSFYTPVQSASNLLEFGTIQESDRSASLSSADVSLSPLQSFTTPLSEPSLKIHKPRSIQPKDLIRERWRQRNIDTGICTMSVDSATRSNPRLSSGSLRSSHSNTTWFDMMLSRDLGSSTPHMWEDTPSGYQDSMGEDSLDDGPKKRRDTPYYPKFQNPRLDHASTSYLFGDNRFCDTHNLMASGASRQGTCKRELIPSSSLGAPPKGLDPVRCSSCPCKDKTCDHTGFDSNISPITFANPSKNLNPRENFTGDDAVFLDDELNADEGVSSDIAEEDWGKRYSGEYYQPLSTDKTDVLGNAGLDLLLPASPGQSSDVGAGCSTTNCADLEKTTAYAFGPETNSDSVSMREAALDGEEDSAESMLDYIIQVSKKRAGSEQFTIDSSVDFQSSVSDIFAPIDVGDTQPQDIGGVSSNVEGSLPADTESIVTDPHQANIENITRINSNQNEGQIQSSQYLESNSDFGEIVDSSVSDHDDHPFRMLQPITYKNDVPQGDPAPQNDESLSPVFGNRNPMLSVDNEASNAELIVGSSANGNSEEPTQIEEVIIDGETLNGDSPQTFGNITHEDLDLSDHTGDYSPNPVESFECPDGHVAGRFRADPVHHPDVSVSFTDSSQSMGESVNIDSILKSALFSVDDDQCDDSEELDEKGYTQCSDDDNSSIPVENKETTSVNNQSGGNLPVSESPAVNDQYESEMLIEKTHTYLPLFKDTGPSLQGIDDNTLPRIEQVGKVSPTIEDVTALLAAEFNSSLGRDGDDTSTEDLAMPDQADECENWSDEDLNTLLLLPFAHTSLSGCLSIPSPDESRTRFDDYQPEQVGPHLTAESEGKESGDQAEELSLHSEEELEEERSGDQSEQSSSQSGDELDGERSGGQPESSDSEGDMDGEDSDQVVQLSPCSDREEGDSEDQTEHLSSNSEEESAGEGSREEDEEENISDSLEEEENHAESQNEADPSLGVLETDPDRVMQIKRSLFNDSEEVQDPPSPHSFPPSSTSSPPPSPSSCGSGSFAFEERQKLSVQELRTLLYDPPIIDSSKLEENVRFRQQQVEDYEYYLGRSKRMARRADRKDLVSWSNRLIQLILYDDDVWCNASDTTIEDDGSMELDLML